MNRVRLQRVVIIALMGVGLVLLITVLSNRGRGPAGSTRVGVTSEQLPPAPVQGEAPQRTLTPDVLRDAGTTVIQRTDKATGRLLQEFSSTKITPQEGGVFDLRDPMATLYLKGNRVIRMKSDTGRFFAPDQYPQSGEFRDNLVVTIFESPEGRRVDLSPRSADRVIRLKMDRATFDKTTGEVQSESDVDLYTPNTRAVQFKGRGLKLVYNEVNGRVEYLEIAHGKSVRYNPDAAQEPAAGEAGKGVVAAGGDPAKAHDARRELQYYRITFERGVKVVSEGRTIEADALVAFLTLDRAKLSDGAAGPGTGAAAISDEQVLAMVPAMVGRVVNVLPLIVAQSAAAAGDQEGMPAGDRDVTMTWSGKMVMVPVDSVPREVAGAEDLYLRFDGSPVTVTDKDGRLLSQAIEYLHSARRVTATGSSAFPLRLDSPELGTISASQLVYDGGTSEARFVGGGYLRAGDKAGQGGGQGALPAGFRITWKDSLDVLLASSPRPGGGGVKSAAGAGLAEGGTSLRAAIFRGDVQVDDPQFKLRTAELAAGFAPAPGTTKPQLRAIDARGNVSVRMEDRTVDASKLHIDTSTDAGGKIQPSRLVAEGRVRMVDPQQALEAAEVNVELVAKAAGGGGVKVAAAKKQLPAGRGAADGMGVEPGLVKARGDVVIVTADGRKVRAQTVEADARAGWAVLTGAPVVITEGGDEARGVAPKNEFRVLKLRVEELANKRYKAVGEGAGTLAYIDMAGEGREPRRYHVAWTHSMNFDGQANLVQLLGLVSIDTQEEGQRFNHISANQVTLELIDPELVSRIVGESGGGGAGSGGADMRKMVGSRLRRLVARDNVKLQAGQGPRENPQTRVSIYGPNLVYRQAEEVAEVVGPGRMLIEDYRPADAQASDALKEMKLTGRGRTMFDWTRKMTMDRMRADISIEGDANMLHVAQGTEREVRLRAETLTADLVAKTGVARPTDLGGETFAMNRVAAEGGVRLLDPGELLIECHSIVYDEKSQAIVLAAIPGRKGRLSQLREGRGGAFENAVWDIQKKQLLVKDVGTAGSR